MKKILFALCLVIIFTWGCGGFQVYGEPHDTGRVYDIQIYKHGQLYYFQNVTEYYYDYDQMVIRFVYDGTWSYFPLEEFSPDFYVTITAHPRVYKWYRPHRWNPYRWDRPHRYQTPRYEHRNDRRDYRPPFTLRKHELQQPRFPNPPPVKQHDYAVKKDHSEAPVHKKD